MRKISKSIILATLIAFFAIKLAAAADLNVQYIAVHFGEASNMEVLDKSEFPQFEFYTADGDVLGYFEEQKMMGGAEYLSGWYGKVPEKMGFCANYRGEYKGRSSFPHQLGAIYVLDKNGTITYQTPPEKMTTNAETGIRNGINRAIRRAKKGKEGDVMKEKKREYLKQAPVGEREPRKGADVDKKGEGLLEWPVPDIQVTDESGNTTGLRELAQGKATVLVLFTLNGVTWQRGSSDGSIEAEWKGNKLMTPDQYAQKSEKDFEKDADKDKGGLGNAAKFIGKEAVKSMGRQENIRDIWSSEGDLSADKKATSYNYFLTYVKLVDR